MIRLCGPWRRSMARYRARELATLSRSLRRRGYYVAARRAEAASAEWRELADGPPTP